MSYTINNLNKLNNILQFTEAQISALSNNNILGIDLSSLNPIMKAGTVNDFIGSDITVQNLHTNSITSIGINDDLIIDANGTGIINLNTLTNGGVTAKGGNTTNLAIKATNSTNTRCVAIGTKNNITERPTVDALTTDMITPAPMWIQNISIGAAPASYLVIGSVAESTASGLSSKLIVEGKITSTDAIRVAETGTTYHEITGNATGIRTHTLLDRSTTITPTYYPTFSCAVNPSINVSSYAVFTEFAFHRWRGSAFSIPLTGNGQVTIVFNADGGKNIDLQLYDIDNITVLGNSLGVVVTSGLSIQTFTFNLALISSTAARWGVYLKFNSAASGTVLEVKDCYYTLGTDSVI